MSNRTELKHEFLGMSADNPFVSNISAPRAVMHQAHSVAHIALLAPDERLIKSGIEYEMGKYINDVRAPENSVVCAIIPRYKEYGIEAPSTTVFIEYEKDYEDGRGIQLMLDLIEVPIYRSNNGFFGYNLTPTETLNNVSFGSVLHKDQLLAQTDSYGREGSYNVGLNANVAFMSHPSVAEDGFVVSESFAKRGQFLSITKRVININKNTIPVNLYGKDGEFKFMPNIGEKVVTGGLLCAIRDRNDFFSICDLNDKNLNEFDGIFDIPTYVNVDSVVVDIQVIKGNSKPEFSSRITKQLDDYAQMLTNYYSRVTAAFEQIMEDKRKLYGNVDAVRLSPAMHRFITDSYVKLQASTNRKNAICYRKLAVDQYRVEIICKNVITPTLGYKLADNHGHKGVICAVLPDEHMPIDKNGVRVDVISDSASTISRMNPGRAYEAYIGATSRDERAKFTSIIKERFSVKGNIVVSSEMLGFVKGYLKNLYSLLNSDMVYFIETLDDEELQAHVREVIDVGLYLYYPPDNEKNVTDVITDIEQSPHRPLADKLTYVNALGQIVRTQDDIQVGVLYFTFLEKIANLYSAVSSSKVNNFGFPVKGANVDKHRYPHSQTPGKFLAETENRILISHVGKAAVAEMVDLAQNPTSHKTIYKHIIQNPTTYNANFDIDRGDINLGQTKSLQILNHIFTAAGFKMIHVDEV